MRIQLLGSPAILVDGQRVEHPARKVMALLTYLAVRADEHLSRGHLAALLWADSGEEQARANLRQTLSQLRKLFQTAGHDPILVPFDKIVLQSQYVEIDLQSVFAHLDRLSLADLARIAPFAEGLDLQAPEFESWAAVQRRMIQSHLVAHLRDRAAIAREAAHHSEVAETLSLALTLDNLQEDLHRDLMQSLAALGRSDEALKQYELCRDVLRRELQVEPEAATRALAASIRSQRQFHVTTERAAPAFVRFPTPEPAWVLAQGPGVTEPARQFGNASNALAHALSVLRSAAKPEATAVAVIRRVEDSAILGQTEKGTIAVAADVAQQFHNWSPYSFDGGLSLPDGRVIHRLLSEMPHHRLQVLPTVPEPAQTAVPEFSVAVLPFQDQSQEAAYFSLGDLLAEEIIHRLSRHRGLIVAAPSAGQAFRSLGHPQVLARRMLGVNYLVDGRILRNGDRMMVHLTLTDLRRDHLIFSHKFDGIFPGLLLGQNDLADQIASTLFHKTQGAEILRAERMPTTNHGAFEWYLRGLSEHRRSGISPEFARAAFGHFTRAIDLDPRFARAIAWRLCAVSWFDPGFLDQPGYQQIQQALTFADDDAEVHRVAGALCMQRGDHDQGIRHLERAIEINPSDAYLLATSAVYWAYDGAPERGLPHINRAMQLDPFLPAWCVEDHGIVLYTMDDFEGAIHALRKLASPSLRSLSYLAASQTALGQFREARATVRRIDQISPRYSITDLMMTAYFRRSKDRELLQDRLSVAGLAVANRPDRA